MNGEIDIVTRRTLKPDWQVNAEKDKNGCSQKGRGGHCQCLQLFAYKGCH